MFDTVRFYSRKGRLARQTLLHRSQALQRCTQRLGYPTQASDIHSASRADTGVQLVWACLHEEMVYFRWDVLDGLLSIDIGGYTLFGKYSVDFGAVIGRQFPVAGSDILFQLLLVAHANQRHRNGRIPKTRAMASWATDFS